MHRFGFGRPTGVELPGEQAGIVPALENYSGSSMGNMPIGQGIAVTPMQMASAYTAIANHGVMRRPYIVEGRPAAAEAGAQAAHRRAGLAHARGRARRPGGTAEEAQVEGYKLAGKTGTAEKAIKGGYSKTDFIASFIGYAPARDPRLLVAVMVDDARAATSTGAPWPRPHSSRIMEFALPYLKIPPR